MRISLSDVQAIANVICKAISCQVIPLIQELHGNHEILSSGDPILDKELGGGIHTGMVWEIVGERYDYNTNLIKSSLISF